MKNASTTIIKAFVQWAIKQQKPDKSGTYSENTIRHHYVRALKRGVKGLQCNVNSKDDFFTITDPATMLSIRNELYKVGKPFKDFCRSGQGRTGNNDLTAAIKLYLNFLKEWDYSSKAASNDEEKEEYIEDEVLVEPSPWDKKPKKPYAKSTVEGKRIKRDKMVYLHALNHAKHKCELCHKNTFINKSTGLQYVEGHHLIPLSCQKSFNYNLDVEENVVALCPMCHSKLHHAEIKEIEKDLKGLLSERQKDLSDRGINIDSTSLIHYYSKNNGNRKK